MHRTLVGLTALCLTLLTLIAGIPAQVRLAQVFANNMVLQRGISIPVWGTASNGETISVTLLSQTTITKAVGGRWMVRLKSCAAGGPYAMTVRGAANKITLVNVMIGDVWLCSGQSNMTWPLGLTANGAAAMKTAANENIRLFTSPKFGWTASSATSAGTYSAVAYYFGRELAQNLGVTVGLIQAAAGSTQLDVWRRGGTMEKTLIAPLVPYALRGAIWYQGEADAIPPLSLDYASRFQALIREWREGWGQGDFPFLYVQLPRYSIQSPDWLYIREAQLETFVMPDTSMVCTIDIISSGGIHPTLKLPVGQRLALAARRIAYGQNIVHSGPVYDPEKTSVAGNKMLVGFRHVGSGLTSSGGTVKGFEIAGKNLAFVPATANIVGNNVEVSSPTVSNPVAVRYAWALNPNANLFNRDGLPASPFRSLAAYWTFGKGCGVSPLPSLRATLLPRLGRPFELRLEHLEGGKPGLILVGLSDRVWTNQILPLDLAMIGMHGCKLYVSGEVQIGFVADFSRAFDLRLPVPNASSLVGVTFFNQAVVTYPGASSVGLAATNAGRGRVGPH